MLKLQLYSSCYSSQSFIPEVTQCLKGETVLRGAEEGGWAAAGQAVHQVGEVGGARHRLQPYRLDRPLRSCQPCQRSAPSLLSSRLGLAQPQRVAQGQVGRVALRQEITPESIITVEFIEKSEPPKASVYQSR